MDSPASRFGPFELLLPLGRGGVADVWLARPAGSPVGSELVVKRLRPRVQRDLRVLEMFEQEAAVGAAIDHPGLIRTLGFGTLEDEPVLVLPFIFGADLTRIAKRKLAGEPALDRNHALVAIRDAARALHALHTAEESPGRAAGWVHRDVSPANLMIGYDGRTHVIDLGIVRRASTPAEPGREPEGKFAYMSPEQASGEAVDARSDVFSLGVVLYEFALGRRLFRRGSPEETVAAIQAGDIPRPRVVDPAFPLDLEAIVLQSLAPRAADRTPSAAALADALDDALAAIDPLLTPAAVGRRLRKASVQELAILEDVTEPGYRGPTRAPRRFELPPYTPPQRPLVSEPSDDPRPSGVAPDDANARPDVENAPPEGPEAATPDPDGPPVGTVKADHEIKSGAPIAVAEAEAQEAVTEAQEPVTEAQEPATEDATGTAPRDDAAAPGASLADEALPPLGDGSGIYKVVAALIVIVLGVIGYVIATEGVDTSIGDDIVPMTPLSEFDAAPLEVPDPPATVALEVSSTPAGAWIVVNGIATRTQTPSMVEVVEGRENVITLHADTHATAREQVVGGASAQLQVELPPIPALPSPTEPTEATDEAVGEGSAPPREVPEGMGRIRVIAEDVSGQRVEAEVLRNGDRVEGTTPLELIVPAGVEQHITVRRAGYRDSVTYTRAIAYEDLRSEREVLLQLTREVEGVRGATTVRVTATPAQAGLRVDGEDQGRLNVLTLRAPGHYVVEAFADDHTSVVQTIDTRLGQMEFRPVLAPIRTGAAMVDVAVTPDDTTIYAERLRAGSSGATTWGTGAVMREAEAGPWRFTLERRGEEGRQRGRFEVEIAPETTRVLRFEWQEGGYTLIQDAAAPRTE